METEEALAACQFKVTLCPGLIELALAENTSVGLEELAPSPLQEQSPHKAIGIVPQANQRKIFVLIRCLRDAVRIPASGDKMPGGRPLLAVF
jgi:hypothetical protein